jgi:hypothetical protein
MDVPRRDIVLRSASELGAKIKSIFNWLQNLGHLGKDAYG